MGRCRYSFRGGKVGQVLERGGEEGGEMDVGDGGGGAGSFFFSPCRFDSILLLWAREGGRADVAFYFRQQCTSVTACGNFGLVGSDKGDVVMFNLQSGMKRKVFKVPNAGENDSKGRCVTGITTDSLNRVVVVSTLKGEVHVRSLLSCRCGKAELITSRIHVHSSSVSKL